jgi:hypothetical protein
LSQLHSHPDRTRLDLSEYAQAGEAEKEGDEVTTKADARLAISEADDAEGAERNTPNGG